MFETSFPDEILLKICRYLSWFDVIIAFYNLNSRFNRTLSGYLKHASIGNDCCLKDFQHGCSFLLDHQSSLFLFIRTLTISNRGSPLAAKYFLSHIPIQDMFHLEKMTLVEFTGDEILSYLDVIERSSENMFRYFTVLHIDDPQYINGVTHGFRETPDERKEYESIMINRILTGNKQRLKSIIISGDDMHM
jgi:hypothetical protein